MARIPSANPESTEGVSRRSTLRGVGFGAVMLAGIAGLTACTTTSSTATAGTTPDPTGAGAPTDTGGASAAARSGTATTSQPARIQPTTLTGLVFDDDIYDGQLVRLLDNVYAGGADVGEAIMTARRIAPGDDESWFREWTATADRINAIAENSLAAGHLVSARQAYSRAAMYYRSAGGMMYKPPMDPRFIDTYQKQRAAFANAAKLSERPIERVEIPYEETTLEGWFARPDGEGPFPTLVMVDGYDGTKEELYFLGGLAVLDRGYAVLMVDGPGQGGALIEQGLVFRPDWEKVVTPQIDWLYGRPEVDRQRIVLMGRSWGGYLAPRAATAEHRIAALVADAAQYAPGAGAVELVPEALRPQFETGDPAVLNAALEQEMAAVPQIAFILNRGMLTHGMKTPLDYLRGSAPYTNEGLAGQITCPAFICEAEGDFRAGDAKPLYDAIETPKKYVLFKNADGAGQHCESGAAALFSQVVFDWLSDTLDLA